MIPTNHYINLVSPWIHTFPCILKSYIIQIYRYIAHVDVIKWKHFPSFKPFVRGILRSPVDSIHKCQWRGALMFSLMFAWLNDWVNSSYAGDLWRHGAPCDVTVMEIQEFDHACLVLINSLRVRVYSKRFLRSTKSQDLHQLERGKTSNRPFEYSPNVNFSPLFSLAIP